MPSETIYRTVHQHSKGQISPEDMKKLQEIAEDYCKVKNYVYARYGSIGSLSKLYPGYTVQNEMTKSGLKDTLGIPSVYFYLAIFDALGDIKSQWTRIKSKIQELIGKNERFSPEERHYLRFLLRINNAFEAVLCQKAVQLPKDIQKTYEEVADGIDTEKLHKYLCRLVRKYHVKQHTDQAAGFAVSERAYRYKDHGIYISVKEKRRRVFVPLTDNNQYKCQIYIKLDLENSSLNIQVPVQTAPRNHEDYTSRRGVAMGIYTMLTTDEGHRYGEELGKYQIEYADWVRCQAGVYSRNREDNPGRKKYNAKKNRLTQQMHSYINHELNRFLQTEKPEAVYMAKLPPPQAGGVNKKINHSVAMWQRGYIRSRLEQKCGEHSVTLIKVWGKDISNECSICGALGTKSNGRFLCGSCGYSEEEKTNTARNALKRGLEDIQGS